MTLEQSFGFLHLPGFAHVLLHVKLGLLVQQPLILLLELPRGDTR